MTRVGRRLLPAVLLLMTIGCGWSAAHQVDPLYEEAYRLIEAYNGQEGYLDRASDLTARLLEKDPGSAPGLLNAARLILLRGYLSNDEFDQNYVAKAQQLVDRALKIAPDFANGHILGAYAFLADKSARGMRRAKAMAQRGEELAPDSVRLELLYARIAKAEENWDEVLRRANRALAEASDPNLIRLGHGYLVDVYRHRQQYDLAERAYRTILEFAPDAPWPRINFAGFLNARGRYEEAIGYGAAALAIRDFGMGHRVLGQSYFKKAADLLWQQKRYEEAKPYFALAIEHAPDNANAHYGLGMACYRTGHRTKDVAELKMAEKAFEQALRLDPDHKQAKEQLESLRKLLAWVEKGAQSVGGERP